MPHKYSDQAFSLIFNFLDDDKLESPPRDAMSIYNARVWTEALHIAEKNGILYSFCQRALENELVLPEKLKRYLALLMEREMRSSLIVQRTLNFVSSFLRDRGFHFLFIKLHRGLTYVPRDVDVLIRQTEASQIISSLKQEGFQVSSSDNVESTVFKEGYMKLDLYQSFSYLSLPFMDTEFVWRMPRFVKIFGAEYPIPSVNADLLTLSIHALLAHRYLSFLDFLYARSLLKSFKVMPSEILFQIDEYGWTHAFLKFISTVNDLDNRLCLGADSKEATINFPKQFSAKYLLQAFGDFADLPIDTRRKLMFIASTLVDAAQLRYQSLSYSHSIEVEGRMKDILQETIYKIRHLVGDSKAHE